MGEITDAISAVRTSYDARHGGSLALAINDARAALANRLAVLLDVSGEDDDPVRIDDVDFDGLKDDEAASLKAAYDALSAECRQLSREVTVVKAAAHETALVEARSKDGRLVLDRGDGRVITLSAIERRAGSIRMHVEWSIDGKPQPFNNPWIIVNPPCLVADENGDIVRENRDPETGKVIETRRYREDPMAALVEIVDDKCRRPSRQAIGSR